MGGGCRSQGIEHIVAAVDMERYVGVRLTVDQHVEHRQTVLFVEVGRRAVGGAFQAEGEDGALQSLNRVHGTLIVGVDDDMPCRRYQLGKLMEGVLDVVEILEEVQMVRLNVQDHGDRGEEA